MRLAVTVEVVMADDARHRTVIAMPGRFADRVAFEHHFEMSSAGLDQAVLALIQSAIAKTAMDPTQVVREEWLGFLVWRALRHDKAPGVPASFDAFVELVEEVGVEKVDWAGGEGSPDPTVPAAATGPTPPPG